VHDTAAILAGVEEFVTTWLGTAGLVTPALGPFAPGVCSDPLLQGLGELSRRHKLPMHTHLAEARWQADHSVRDQGKRLVRRLDDLGLLSPTFSMAHAVWLEDDEIGLLAQSGASVVHNPLSNMMLGSGTAPIARLRAAGVGVALGTDGPNCGCVTDFFEHMRLSVAVHRPQHMNWREWATARDALTWATEGGAQALGLADDLGHIRIGYRADLVVHQGDRQRTLDSDAAITSFVYTGSASEVRHVIVDGRSLIREGQFTSSSPDRVAS
jgi:5-methylthioadenosine/S-adenosylhomocysteine deaminase